MAGSPRAHINATGLEVLALITATGGQIKFPATQVASADANTLDDYEEASSTPVPTAGSGSFTTVSSTLATTKVGNRVLIDLTVTITTNGTAATNVIVATGLSPTVDTALSGFLANSNVLSAAINTAGNIFIRTATGGYPGADGAILRVSGVCRV